MAPQADAYIDRTQLVVHVVVVPQDAHVGFDPGGQLA
jgi:hypothetical protein